MRRIEELLKLDENARVSPAENAALIAHFSKKEKELNPATTVYFAIKGFGKKKVREIQDLAEAEVANEKKFDEIKGQLKDLQKQLEASKGLK